MEADVCGGDRLSELLDVRPWIGLPPFCRAGDFVCEGLEYRLVLGRLPLQSVEVFCQHGDLFRQSRVAGDQIGITLHTRHLHAENVDLVESLHDECTQLVLALLDAGLVLPE